MICFHPFVIASSPPGSSKKYCDQCVCVSECLFVCLSLRLSSSKTTRPNFTKFSAHVTCGRVARSSFDGTADTLDISGFVDDVMFSCNAGKARIKDDTSQGGGRSPTASSYVCGCRLEVVENSMRQRHVLSMVADKSALRSGMQCIVSNTHSAG